MTLQRHSRTLHALADRWTVATPTASWVTTRYSGAPDLNAPVATQLDGVLFMEGEGEPRDFGCFFRDRHGLKSIYEIGVNNVTNEELKVVN